MAGSDVNRREFLKTSVAGAAALSLSAASARRVLGANERIGVAFLGTGGRCQEHIGVITQMQKDKKGVEAVAVCDVWDGNDAVNEIRHILERFDRRFRFDNPRCIERYVEGEVSILCHFLVYSI